MPKARITLDLNMHYEVDDYTDPWLGPETILLLHGSAGSGAAWPKFHGGTRARAPSFEGVPPR